MNKKPTNPGGELRRKTERSRLGFFSSGIALSTFYPCRAWSINSIIVSYQTVTVTFLEFPQDRVSLMFTRKKVTSFINSMRIAERVVLWPAAIFNVSLIIDTKLKLFSIFVTTIYSSLTALLFKNFDAICRLKHLAWP